MEANPAFRDMMGYFQKYHQAEMMASVCTSSFARHVRIVYPLSSELLRDCDNPEYEPVVHLFVLKKDEKFAEMNAQIVSTALEQEKYGDGIQVSNKGGFHSHRDLFESTQRTAPALQHLKRVLSTAVAEAEVSDRANEKTLQMFVDSISTDSSGKNDLEGPTSSWINVNRDGDWNGLHDHEGAVWSGVYYVSIPPSDPKDEAVVSIDDLAQLHSGRLCLRTAVGGFEHGKQVVAADSEHPEGWCQYAYIEPTEGLIVLFPSWLQHGVMPLYTKQAHETTRAKRKVANLLDGKNAGNARVSLAFNFGEKLKSPDLEHRHSGKDRSNRFEKAELSVVTNTGKFTGLKRKTKRKKLRRNSSYQR